MNKPHRIRAAAGKYQDKQGNEKTRWVDMGPAWPRDDGTFSMKIESIPTGWDGNCLIVPPLEDDAQQSRPQRPQVAARTEQAQDDIPF
jgi:hypothetical protein